MSGKREAIGVFVAWPYVNGELHVGHAAGAYLPADIFARYHRLRGRQVLMASGSDCYGTAITVKAMEEGAPPEKVVEKYHQGFLDVWEKLGISFDLFTQTHTENHRAITQEMFLSIHAKGDFFVESQQQFYDESAQMFLPDRYVRGTCPKCKYERARGDQCENCGETLDALELLNPISSVSKTVPVIRETSHFMFDLPKYQERLAAYLAQMDHWRPHVKAFTESMVAQGLRARAITRDLTWGVPVPLEGWEGKVLYVWFDAVIGYLSASKEYAQLEGDPALWERWWKGEGSRAYYFIGKDNIPFHTVVWPVELMAADPELTLPYDVPANQFLNISGEKLSTSGGNAVWLREALLKYDPDTLRYYIATVMPETKDSNYHEEELVQKNNSELVATWGNLVNRVMGFAHTRYEGIIPQCGELTERDTALLSEIRQGFVTVAKLMEAVQLREALREAMRLAREVNKYLDESSPWGVYKTDPVAAGHFVAVAFAAIESVNTLLAPFIPHTCEVLRRAFGHTEPFFGAVVTGKGIEGQPVVRYQTTELERAGQDRFCPAEPAPGRAFDRCPPLFKVLEIAEVNT